MFTTKTFVAFRSIRFIIARYKNESVNIDAVAIIIGAIGKKIMLSCSNNGSNNAIVDTVNKAVYKID